MSSHDVTNLTLPDESVSAKELTGIQAGELDGMTIMRYAPFYRERSSGGVEQLLRRLNLGLLQRHRLTILQVHRVADIRTAKIQKETVGLGQVIWIPVAVRKTTSRFKDIPERGRFIWNQTLHREQYNRQGRDRVFDIAKSILSCEWRHLPHRAVVLSDPLATFLYSNNVDLLAIHGLTYDARFLIRRAHKADIPFVLINHFDNSAFRETQVREWLSDAAGIGSVSARSMPDHVQSRCVNLSDAVDTEYFTPEKARIVSALSRPMILLPAIIKMGKGQQDLLQAARILAARNLSFDVYFVGAVESESLRRELGDYVLTHGLEDRVKFLGELKQDEIRNQFALSSLVVLPTYNEGLGRVLLEAQAMQKPVVAYDSGGVSETFVPGETGFLVKTGDVESLADRIACLLLNEEQRKRMGELGRKFMQNKFSVSALIQRHEAFYLKAVSGGKSASANDRLQNRGVRALRQS
jgi:glycosyltransferase involved in cell wall biosynthesis